MKHDCVASYWLYLQFTYPNAGTASTAGIHPATPKSADSSNVIMGFINSFHHINALCSSGGFALPQFSNGQPGVYSAIIQEVVGSLKADFDEFGVGEDVLRTLQQKWESRVIASRAADFSDPQAHLGLAGANPHSAQYTGIGAVAINNAIPRTGSPNIHRTNSPASVAHSRVASRTNSIGASSMNPLAGASGNTYNRTSSNSFSSSGGQSTPTTNNVQVKAEPVDRFPSGLNMPPMPSNQPNYSNYNPGMPHMQMPPNMNMSGGVPNLSSFGNNIPSLNMNSLNAYGASRGVPGYGSSAGNGPSDSRSILMLPRGAAPYNPPAASAASGGTNGATKIPQLDGAWDEEGEHSSRAKREWLTRRYPWMAEAQIHSLNANLVVGEEQMPQVDGPTPATPPVPPLNLLPPLNLGSSSSGLNRDGAPPPLTLPPLNLPPLGGGSGGSRALHPSLMNNPTATVVELKRDSPPPGSFLSAAQAGPSSSFARNPNVPAQPSEDINSDLDDTDDEDGPQEQPGSDPDADVTYCTYDKVTRVKTKWKVVFRDGMVHANGKDYLFGRCTGEFDW